MYAVVSTVRIAAGQFETASKALHSDVVPRVSKAPGFARAHASRMRSTRFIGVLSQAGPTHVSDIHHATDHRAEQPSQLDG